MSEKQAAHNHSPENVERLRNNLQAARANGKKPTRQGVPDGWKGATRRRRLKEVQARAHEQAGAVIAKMQAAGLLPAGEGLYGPDGTINIDAAAQAALRFNIAVLLAVDEETGQAACTMQNRLEAARTFLAYTMPPARAVSRRDAKIGQAEHVLSLILATAE